MPIQSLGTHSQQVKVFFGLVAFSTRITAVQG